MITIGPASYFSTTNRYADASRSRAASSYADAAEQQATDSKATSGEQAVDPRSSTTTFNVMGQQYKLIPIDASKMKPLDISKLPEDQYREFMEGDKSRIEANERFLKLRYSFNPDEIHRSNSPLSKPYATVTIGGQEVAKIFNDGSVQTYSDDVTDRIRDILESSANVGGPEGAQARAEQIARKLGGRVSKAPTALTQAQYNALPPYVPAEPIVDYEGMKNDPMYAQIQQWKQHYSQREQNRAAYLASQQSGVNISA